MMTFQQQLNSLIDKRHVGASYAVCASKGEPARILCAQLVLQPRPMPPEWNALTERHGLIVARGWIDISRLRAALDENGTLLVQRTFALSNKPGNTHWSLSNKDAGDHSRWTMSELTATGAPIYEVLGGVDAFRVVQRRLPSFTPPFRDWTHLREYLQLDHRIESNNSSSFSIIAPTFATIEATNVTLERELLVLVRSYEQVADLALVVIADDDSWPPQTVGGDAWAQHGPSSWRATVDCKQLVGPGTVQLLFRDECVHQVRFGIPPLALRAHLALDAQMEWLQSLVGTGRKAAKGDGFEVGVANLLALCGLAPVHYGHTSRDEFPDIVCAVHENLLLVAECTVTSPPPLKIENLVARAEAIRGRASVDGEVVDLLRVLFVACSEQDIPGDLLVDAREDRSVAILCREHIAALTDMAARGETPETLEAVLLAWISRFGAIRR